MTDVQDSTDGSEPSMEEILASIRRIIADEKEEPEETAKADASAEEEVMEPVAVAQEEEALELTQAIKDDGSIEDVKQEEPEKEPEPEIEMSEVEKPAEAEVEAEKAPEEVKEEPEPPKTEAVETEDEALVSDDAASSASASLANLASKVENERQASMSTSFLGNGNRTLEDMVMELMKPMLKTWLDENLPNIVDHIVQKEVERIAGKIEK